MTWNLNKIPRRLRRIETTILEGLTPGTIYVVQVRYIGSAGPSDWSDPAAF